MDNLLRDLRFALRALGRTPAFTAAAVLALALGIGGSSAIFSVLDGVVLRPLQAPRPAELVRLYEKLPGDKVGGAFSPADYVDLAGESRSFASMASLRTSRLTMTTAAGPVQLPAARVTASFFAVLGASPARGRGFSPDSDKAGGPGEVILTDALWRREFSADPRIVGQSVMLDGRPTAVVGVMPPGFRFPLLRGAEALAPMEFSKNELENRGMHSLHVIGRLAPGAALQQAAAELEVLGPRIAARLADHHGMTMRASPLLDDLVGPVKPLLAALLGAVLCVLLIACANVAGMLLARGAARQREIAIRAALGGGRARLVRQLLTETLLLSFAGGALGVLLAAWGVEGLLALAPGDIPRMDEVRLSPVVLLFSLGLSLFSGLLAGLWPALQASRPDLALALKDGSGGATSRGRARSALVVIEIALSLVLVIGAGLMIRTLQRLLSVPVGLADPARVLVADVDLPSSKYARDEQIVGFQQDLLRRASALPGVKAAAFASAVPLDGRWAAVLAFQLTDRPRPPPSESPDAEVVWATPGYLDALGIPLLRGRNLADTDTVKSQRVVLVNEAFARKHFGGGDDALGGALGRRLDHFLGEDKDAYEIAGVIGNVHTQGLDKDPQPQIVVPFAQFPVSFMRLAVRSTGPRPLELAPLLRTEVMSIDRDQPFAHPRTLAWVVSDSVGQRRFQMTLLTLFGAFALALAALGIYGVMAYSVAQRSREFGIRMALGAQASEVLRMVVGGGLRLALAGVAIGVPAALLVTRALKAALYQVSAGDPLTFAAVALAVTAVAALASFVPARRATRVDPATPLRAE